MVHVERSVIAISLEMSFSPADKYLDDRFPAKRVNNRREIAFSLDAMNSRRKQLILIACLARNLSSEIDSRR